MFEITFLMLIVAVPLQFYLSKKYNKWLGLILPIIYFTISIFAVLSAFQFVLFPPLPSVHEVYENGVLISSESIEQTKVADNIIPFMLLTFLYYNLPTIILCVIYAVYRKKRIKSIDIEKMNIQDL
ncbi:MAG TPA: hypothetical protein VIK78_03050 [Ruminiclostridium sp.]